MLLVETSIINAQATFGNRAFGDSRAARYNMRLAERFTFSMQAFWTDILRYSRAIIVFPTLLGIALALLTGRTLWFGIAVIWFLSLIAIETGAETLLSVQHKLPRRKRDALVEFLSTGGYSLSAASMAAYFAFAFWTSYRPRWLVTLMFVGIVMFFSSGFVYKRRSRGKTPKQEENS